MLTGEYKNKIKNIYQVFYESGMGNSLQVIEQVTYLLFIKLLDDNEIKKESVANSMGYNLDEEDKLFDVNHQNCRWHVFKNYDNQKMFNNMIEHVFPFIKNELTQGNDTAFSKYIKDAIFMIPNAHVLDRVISALDILDLNDKDTMGDVYETLLSELQQSGKDGQFRTPRHIIKMMVDLMRPKITDKICDPAMGSAGFISCAAQFVSENYKTELLNNETNDYFNNKMFSGFDMDQTMLRIGAMNMMLHGVEAANIAYQDSLSEDNPYRNEYSLILANPPFAGHIDKSKIAKDLVTVAKTDKTELLFLALFTKLLRVGGRCASIVPDGVLFGSSNAHQSIRKELIDKNRLEAVISMPSGVFQPYAGVKTSILIFSKDAHNPTNNVWFYEMHGDGTTLDVKHDVSPNNDIPDIIERFHNLEKEKTRTRKDQSFFVPVSEIREKNYDLSFSKYKEIEKIEKTYRPTSVILNDIRSTYKELGVLIESIDELKGE